MAKKAPKSNNGLTAETATEFSHTSSKSAEILASVAAERGCTCKAYVDWFTYNRWQAQGMQVQKGEKGVRLVSFPEQQVEDAKGKTTTTRRPKPYSVFCRCQVAPKSNGNGRTK